MSNCWPGRYSKFRVDRTNFRSYSNFKKKKKTAGAVSAPSLPCWPLGGADVCPHISAVTEDWSRWEMALRLAAGADDCCDWARWRWWRPLQADIPDQGRRRPASPTRPKIHRSSGPLWLSQAILTCAWVGVWATFVLVEGAQKDPPSDSKTKTTRETEKAGESSAKKQQLR